MTALAPEGLMLGMETDLSSSVRELVRRVRETGRGVILGDDGGDVAVVLSVSAFERLQAAAAQPALQRAVDEAEAEVSRGELLDHDEVMEQLRRWVGRRPAPGGPARSDGRHAVSSALRALRRGSSR